MYTTRSESKDGYEMHLATNHLGHFLLTNLLLNTLKASKPSRIITVSSAAHRYGRINCSDLNMENSYNQYQAYFQSKLANILFARSLARQLSDFGVTSNSLNPGIVHTLGVRRCVLEILISPLTFFMKTPKNGAQTSIMLAVDPELENVTGQYFSDCAIASVSKAAQCDETAAWLWEASVFMIQNNII